MMSEAEKANLIKSMQDDGFDAGCPIVLYDGLILDGRNRYEAAKAAGVEPTFTTYEGGDPLAFVIRHNLHRRHLNETQRGLVASRLANMERGNFHGNQHKEVSANLRIPTESERAVIANKLAEESDKWAERIRQHTGSFKPTIKQSEAAEMLNVSERTIQTVKAVEREAPELLPLMEAGKMTAHEAMKEVKKIVKDNKGSTEDIPKEDADLIKKIKKGETVVINIDKNFHALKYAKDNDLYVQVDRWSDWGNPYLIGQDGDRDQVIESYKIYFSRKFGLQKKLHNLKGKALGCHCYPERCHGDHLKTLADGD